MNAWQESLRFVLVDGSLLVGLFIAITLLVFLAQQLALGRSIQQRLTGVGPWRGAGLAAVGGAITPFCSCSTVPVLSGMLRSDIRLAACFSFLIASPVINEGVIILLASGPGVTSAVAFVVMASLVCVIVGVAVERGGMLRFVKIAGSPGEPVPEGFLGDASTGTSRPPFSHALRIAWAATRMELRQLLPYLLLGIAIGGLIYGLVPAETLVGLNQRFPPHLLVPVAAAIAVPVYISPMAAVPVGFALLEKGMAPGAVIAFLIAGAGTSLPEMIMLGRLFMWPLIVAHILAVVAAALILGFSAQWWFS